MGGAGGLNGGGGNITGRGGAGGEGGTSPRTTRGNGPPHPRLARPSSHEQYWSATPKEMQYSPTAVAEKLSLYFEKVLRKPAWHSKRWTPLKTASPSACWSPTKAIVRQPLQYEVHARDRPVASNWSVIPPAASGATTCSSRTSILPTQIAPGGDDGGDGGGGGDGSGGGDGGCGGGRLGFGSAGAGDGAWGDGCNGGGAGGCCGGDGGRLPSVIVGNGPSQPRRACPSFHWQYCRADPNERQYSASLVTGKLKAYDENDVWNPEWQESRSTCLKMASSP